MIPVCGGDYGRESTHGELNRYEVAEPGDNVAEQYNLLVHVDDAPPQGHGLVCPYCHAPLIAAGATFAHPAPACPPMLRPLRALPVLPLSGRFDADLSSGQIQALGTIGRGGHVPKAIRRVLEQAGYVAWNRYGGFRGGVELTKYGQIVIGDRSVFLFDDLQAPLLRKPLQGFIQAAEWAVRTHRDPLALRVALMDLRLYRAALRRRLLLTFALLHVDLDGRTVYHSAVTERPVAELATALQTHLGQRIMPRPVPTSR